ncbi:MAG: hypothetical protein U1E62_00900 [Alsobacter sp.]
MNGHKYQIGQTVRIVHSTDLRESMKHEHFRVLRLLPENPTGEPAYRVKSDREQFERLVGEHEIAAV